VAGGGLPIIAKLWLLHRRRRRDVVKYGCIVCRLTILIQYDIATSISASATKRCYSYYYSTSGSVHERSC